VAKGALASQERVATAKAAGEQLTALRDSMPWPVTFRTGDVVFQQSPRPLDHRAMKTALLTHHRYVAVVTLSLQCGHFISD
jgi:hypothetical protein